MFAFITNLFFKSSAPVDETPLEIPPGMRVLVQPENMLGTVSGLVDDGSVLRARVVFAGPRRTWVEQVSMHRIVL